MRSLPAGTLLLLLALAPAGAAERVVPAEPGALAAAIAASAPGDVLLLAPGRHRGAVTVDRPLSLRGDGRAEVAGAGEGTVITVTAADVELRGLTVTGSGDSNATLDSAVKLVEGADRARVLDCTLKGNLVGVDIHGARDALVRGNTIEGRGDGRMNDRGNGVYVWNAPGARVMDNTLRWGRDGIFVNTSRDNTFSGNRFEDLRFAVHYMYAHDSEVSGNVSVGNHLGYAIMYSRGVRVLDNVSQGDRDHGIMLNYATDSLVRGNRVRDGRTKCAFLYNAHRNRIVDNHFAGCPIGVHFTAGSERNEISGNAFVGNRAQVKYVGSRWLEWSGNHWSDHAAFDLDGDGVADAPYRPNDVMNRILWTQPAAKLLAGSPAAQLLRWAMAAFPHLLPGGVIDPSPLVQEPA